MASNPKRKCMGASNSFTRAEVDAGVQLFDLLARGGDPRVLIRSPLVRSIHAKFRRMRQSILEGKSGIGPLDGDAE